MSVYKRNGWYWYKFKFANRAIRESSKSKSVTVAKSAEQKRRRELEEGFNNLADNRGQRVQTVLSIATAYLEDYALKHRAVAFAEYAVGHVTRLLGSKMAVDIADTTIKHYQVARLKEKASPKSINEEVGFLLRLLGERGDTLRTKLRRGKALKLKTGPSVGKAFSAPQKDELLKAALPVSSKGTQSQKGSRSPFIRPALVLALNTGMRDAEIRKLTWDQIDLEKCFLTVGKAKSDAGEGRTIPFNSLLYSALVDHSRWYTGKFGIIKPEWYVFPGRDGKPTTGEKRPFNPSKPISSLKTAWANVKKRVGVKGRWHDARHTLITELAESGAGDQTIMDIAGHVSRQMLARYSHIRMEAKRRALQAIVADKPTLPAAPAEGEDTPEGTVQ